MEENIIRQEGTIVERPSRLPARIQDLERLIKVHRSINDHVEDIFIDLYKDPKFRTFLDATSDAEAVEGSQAADNFSAATMVRDAARKLSDDHPLYHKNIQAINLALGVVTRRWGISRKQLRQKVGGQVVPDNYSDGNVE